MLATIFLPICSASLVEGTPIDGNAIWGLVESHEILVKDEYALRANRASVRGPGALAHYHEHCWLTHFGIVDGIFGDDHIRTARATPRFGDRNSG